MTSVDKSRKVGTRRLARSMAVQMLFQRDLGNAPTLAQLFGNFDRLSYSSELAAAQESIESGDTDGVMTPDAVERGLSQAEDAFVYARTLVEGAVRELEMIDGMIRAQADNWRLERMPAVDRNILRLAVYEIVFESEIPNLVVVDEAIELAKQFGSDQSSRFINGLLDGLLRDRGLLEEAKKRRAESKSEQREVQEQEQEQEQG